MFFFFQENIFFCFFFFFQAEDGIRDYKVTGVQTCALPISIIRSSLATRYQLGISFQSGRPAGTVMQLIEIGRCTAARTARSSAEAFCANAVAKASSGSQINPSPFGASFGAWGWGSRR